MANLHMFGIYEINISLINERYEKKEKELILHKK